MTTQTFNFTAFGAQRSSPFFLRKDESVDVEISDFQGDEGSVGDPNIELHASQVGELAFKPVLAFTFAQVQAGVTGTYKNTTGFDVLLRWSAQPGWADEAVGTITDAADPIAELVDDFTRPDGSKFMVVYDEYVDFPALKVAGADVASVDDVAAEIAAALADYYTSAQVDALLADYYTSAQVDALLAAYATLTGVETLTNKRITARSLVNSDNAAEPAINTDDFDYVKFTADQTNDITSMTTNLTGTPVRGDSLFIEFETPAATLAITWGAGFEDGVTLLPVSTDVQMFVAFIWNEDTSAWRCMGVA